jgi:quinol-cytochrome oxidoreductase complex cytochrome b subunit
VGLWIAVVIYIAATLEAWHTGKYGILGVIMVLSLLAMCFYVYRLARHPYRPPVPEADLRERRMVFGVLAIVVVAGAVLTLAGAVALGELTVVIAAPPAVIALRSHFELRRARDQSSS